MEHFITDKPFIYLPDTASTSTSSGLLSGMTLAVKDLFHMQGIVTTAGNPDWLMSHPVPEQTASSVQCLLDAGAQFVGKTITDELAYSLNGQNIHYGTPINPAFPEQLPGGSSSGSAIAVVKGMADIGLGTDTGGSIRVPASYNGLYGLRPTHGRIAMDNMVPLAPRFDTVGWFCISLDNMQKVAQCLFAQVPVEFSGADTRIAIADGLLTMCDYQDQAERWITTHLPQASRLGNTITVDDATRASAAFRTLQGREIWQTHGAWIREQKPVFADDIQLRFNWCSELSDAEQQQAEQDAHKITQQLDQLLQKYDAIVLPTTPGCSPRIPHTPEQEAGLADYRSRLMGLTAFAGLGGLPQLHLPLFSSSNGHYGLSLLGKAGSDMHLIQLAKRILGDSQA